MPNRSAHTEYGDVADLSIVRSPSPAAWVNGQRRPLEGDADVRPRRQGNDEAPRPR